MTIIIPISEIHPIVELSYHLQAKENGQPIPKNMELEIQSFLSSGQSLGELTQSAQNIQHTIQTGLYIVGAFLGFVLWLKLLNITRIRKQTSYRPDSSQCLSCGRCMVYCPRDKKQTRFNM